MSQNAIIRLAKEVRYRLMAEYDFKALKPEIIAAINIKIKEPGFPIDPQGYSLVDGFVVNILQEGVGSNAGYTLGGKAMPTVMIIGNSNARVFYFGLGALLRRPIT